MQGYHPKDSDGRWLDIDALAEANGPAAFADDAIIDLGAPFAPLPPVYGDDGEEIICLDRDLTPPADEDIPW